jgi:hypothetical protein
MHSRACNITNSVLTSLSPRGAVREMRLSCEAIEVPGLGTVPIQGTVMLDEVTSPD